MSTSSALSGADVLSLLTALPLPSSAALELISVHAPFTVSSALPTGALNKWLGRLNAVVTARETLACSIAELVIRQDTEGYVAAQCGKAWMNACLGSLGVGSRVGESDSRERRFRSMLSRLSLV